MQRILQVSRRVENVLLNLRSRELPKYLIEDFKGVEGIVPFVGPQRQVKGNILIDRSLQKPMQVCATVTTLNLQIINTELVPVDMKYIEATIQTAFEKRKELSDAKELELQEAAAFRVINQVFTAPKLYSTS